MSMPPEQGSKMTAEVALATVASPPTRFAGGDIAIFSGRTGPTSQ